jgi:hypothetical protein
MSAKKVVLADLLKDTRPVVDEASKALNAPEPPVDAAGEQVPAAVAPVEPVEPAAPVAPVAPVEPAESAVAPPKRSRSSRSAQKASAAPKFLGLERKEARIRIDQYEELTQMSRKLNRARHGQGERITENTLIRVALDLLLERHRHELSGADEEELRKSVGL